MLRQLQAELNAKSDAEVIISITKEIVDRIRLYNAVAEFQEQHLLPECELEFIKADLLMDSASAPEEAYRIFKKPNYIIGILRNRLQDK